MKSLTSRLAYPVLVMAALSLPTSAYALTKAQADKGFSDCVAWCVDHNKTTASRTACYHQCINYWVFGPGSKTYGLRDR